MTDSVLLDGTNPLIAALLSIIFPGLGHIYARDIETGLFFAVAFICSIVLIFVGIGFIASPAVWLYSIYHAAKLSRARELELRPEGESQE